MPTISQELADIAAAKQKIKTDAERAAAELAEREAAANARQRPLGALLEKRKRAVAKVDELERWRRQFAVEVAERDRLVDVALTNIAPGVVPSAAECYGVFHNFPAAEHCGFFLAEVEKRLTAARAALAALTAECVDFATAYDLVDMLPADCQPNK